MIGHGNQILWGKNPTERTKRYKQRDHGSPQWGRVFKVASILVYFLFSALRYLHDKLGWAESRVNSGFLYQKHFTSHALPLIHHPVTGSWPYVVSLRNQCGLILPREGARLCYFSVFLWIIMIFPFSWGQKTHLGLHISVHPAQHQHLDPLSKHILNGGINKLV